MTDPASNAIKVLASNSTRATLEEALAPAFEQATGYKVELHYDSAKAMLARIKDGETADIAILGTAVIEDLTALGRIASGTKRPFARSRVGVAVRAGAPKPDISTVEAFKRALLNAKSVAHTVHGASGMYVPVLLGHLGIAAQIKPKTVTRPGGYIGVVVASGEAELAVQQICELLAVPGIDLVGPLPDEIQKVFETSAGIFSDAADPEAATAFLEFCSMPEHAPLFKAKGLESVAREREPVTQ
ncbi:MAG: substrate-binding domain-containing protein [Burkholderiales bacterium]